MHTWGGCRLVSYSYLPALLYWHAQAGRIDRDNLCKFHTVFFSIKSYLAASVSSRVFSLRRLPRACWWCRFVDMRLIKNITKLFVERQGTAGKFVFFKCLTDAILQACYLLCLPQFSRCQVPPTHNKQCESTSAACNDKCSLPREGGGESPPLHFTTSVSAILSSFLFVGCVSTSKQDPVNT